MEQLHYTNYLPKHWATEKQEKCRTLMNEIGSKIDAQLPIGIIYREIPRIVLPASLYLQEQTRAHDAIIPHPTRGYPSKMRVAHRGARQAIGMDAIELMAHHAGSKGWKTFHLDKIDELELMTPQDVVGYFGESVASILATPIEEAEGFIKHWNYWFRTFLVERESRYDLRSYQNVRS